MEVRATPLDGVAVIEPRVFPDDRGFFLESYSRKRFAEAGIDIEFVQDNHSRSVGNTLRGLHAQLETPQAKLVRVLRGAIFDVVVDIRRSSPTFRRWFAIELTHENFRQLFVPVGFAHGFCVLSDFAEIEYKCSDFYDPASEMHLAWNDASIGIDWPVDEPILSEKDRCGKPLDAWSDRLPAYEGAKGP